MIRVNIAELIKKADIFSELDEKALEELSDGAEYAVFDTNQTVAPSQSGEYITIIVSGKAAITKPSEDKGLIMRIITAGEITGVASIYGDDKEALSVLVSKTKTKAVFIKADKFRDLVRSDPGFAERYIRFLTSKIRFLNDKIKDYTLSSAETKVASYIIKSADSIGKIKLSVAYTTLADILNIGRASLYRALDYLVYENIITRNGREITVKDKGRLSDIADSRVKEI